MMENKLVRPFYDLRALFSRPIISPILVFCFSVMPYFLFNSDNSDTSSPLLDGILIANTKLAPPTSNTNEAFFLFPGIQFGIAILALCISALLSIYFKNKQINESTSSNKLWNHYLVIAFLFFGLSSLFSASVSQGIFTLNNPFSAVILSWSLTTITYSSLISLSILFLITHNQYRTEPESIKLICAGLFSIIVLAMIIFQYIASHRENILIGHSDDSLISNPLFFLSFAITFFASTLTWIAKKQLPPVIFKTLLLSYIPYTISLFFLSFNPAEELKPFIYVSLLLQLFSCFLILFTLSVALLHESGLQPLTEVYKNRSSNVDLADSNQPLNHHSLVIKFPVFILLITLFISLSISIIHYKDEKKALIQNTTDILRNKSELLIEQFETLQRNTVSNLLILSHLPVLQDYFKLLQLKESTPDEYNPNLTEQIKSTTNQVTTTLTQFASRNRFYMQMRVCDLEGNELIKLVHNNQAIQLTPETELQNKRLRTYFQNSLTLTDNQVYVSNVELNREFGKIELPYQPVIRFVTPIYDLEKETKQGYFIINFAFNAHVNTLKKTDLNDFNLYIANSKGDYLYHPNAHKQYGFELGNKHLIQEEFPEIALSLSGKAESNVVKHISEDEKSLFNIGLFRQFNLGQSNIAHDFILLISEKTAITANNLVNLYYRSLIIAISLSIICLGVSVLIAKTVLSQLFTVIHAMSLYQQTGHHGKIDITTKDEIGYLTSNFKSLLEEMEQNKVEKDRSTKAARENEHILQGILDSAADAIININTTGKILSVNKSAENMFGYSRNEILYQPITLLMPSVHSDNHQQYIEQYLLTGKSKIIGKGRKLIGVRKNGEEFPIHLAISKVHAREGIIFTGMIRDYTEEEQAKKALDESRNKLELVINSAGLGIWDWDIQTGVLNINEKWADIIGYSIDDYQPWTFENWMSLLHPDEKNQALRLLEQHWNGETELFIFENRLRHKNGEWVWALDTGKAIEWFANGKPKRMIGTHLDITHQKQTEKELLESKEAAEKAIHYKSQFLANMSHEIRTPMNGVLGMLELVLRSELDATQQHYLALAKASAVSLLTVINDILDLSKVEAGKLELETIDFNILELLEQVCESLYPQASKKNIELVLDTTDVEYTQISGDPSRIRQILINVLGNAIKFTKQGQVELKAKLELNDGHGCLFYCSIIDSGIGIPREKADHLFQSYSQIESSRSREFGGTGLGLFIVKKLCLLLGGDITVHSTENHGSEFSFWLPLHINSHVQKVQPPFNLRPYTLFLVEDNKSIEKAVKHQLEHWGATFIAIQDPTETLSLLEKHYENTDLNEPSIILIDLNTEHLEAWQLVQEIRKNNLYSSVKIAFLSRPDHPIEKSKRRDAGIIDCISKPITRENYIKLFESNSTSCDPTYSTHQLELTTAPASNNIPENSTTDLFKEMHRILLVDDSQINQTVALGLLELNNLQIDVADNGRHCLDQLKTSTDENPYQLILMDCQMPEMDGFETTKQIRRGECGDDYKDITIIAMTANAMKGDREKCIYAGMNDYITKPIDPDILIEKLLYYLSEQVEPLKSTFT